MPKLLLLGLLSGLLIASVVNTVLLYRARHRPLRQESYADEVYRIQERDGVGNHTFIHLPRSGCPPGYALVPRFFERKGEAFDGCVIAGWSNAPQLGQIDWSVDFLLGQESLSLGLLLRPPPSNSHVDVHKIWLN